MPKATEDMNIEQLTELVAERSAKVFGGRWMPSESHGFDGYKVGPARSLVKGVLRGPYKWPKING